MATGADALPSRLLWDNESGNGRRRPTEQVAAFAGSLGLECRSTEMLSAWESMSERPEGC